MPDPVTQRGDTDLGAVLYKGVKKTYTRGGVDLYNSSRQIIAELLRRKDEGAKHKSKGEITLPMYNLTYFTKIKSRRSK